MSVRVELRRDAGRTGPHLGPWIRLRQIGRVLGPPDPGAVARVVDHRGDTVGWGLLSPDSDIRVRILSFGSDPPGDGWLAVRISAALAGRAQLGLSAQPTTGYREINSEGDRLPGLIVDRYDDTRVVQLTTAPMWERRDEIEACLLEHADTELVCTVPEAAARREGIDAGVWGARHGELSFVEYGLSVRCPAPPGQKTGAYLDQRENRRTIAALAAGRGGGLLDLGCHVGGFCIHAAARGIACVAVDQSESALDLARANTERLEGDVTTIRDDIFGRLDDPRLAGPFGTIVFDPPKIAATRRDRARALEALRGVVGRLLPRVEEGGFFVACSCSHHVAQGDLDAIIARAAKEPWTRVLSLGPGPDHPVFPGHAEGEYLRVGVYQRR